jgi:hypothetical protein
MSPLELLAPESTEAVPFSVRLAARRLTSNRIPSRADRRVYRRRAASDLTWLRDVRLVGGAGYSVALVDISEGGALLEVNAPLRPGLGLTLELNGHGVEKSVPLEVLRCYITSLQGEHALYRGACAFAELIEIPTITATAAPIETGFVGTDAALGYLLERCTSTSGNGVKLTPAGMLNVLGAIHARAAAAGGNAHSRYASDLFRAVMPSLRGGASRDIVLAALEARLADFPRRWRAELEETRTKLVSLIEHCSAEERLSEPSPIVTAPVIISKEVDKFEGVSTAIEPSVSAPADEPSMPAGATAFQKIVVRYADGKLLKGFTQDFHPTRPQFSLWPSVNATPKERVVVPIARLKAVFFVRNFNGNAGYKDRKSFSGSQQGRRVEVTFADGEVLLGTTLNYRPDGQGFFVSPADRETNNTRVFVGSKALRRVRFL